MKRILFMALGAAAVAVAFHLKNRSRHTEQRVNGNVSGAGDDARRVVGEARERIESEAESSL